MTTEKIIEHKDRRFGDILEKLDLDHPTVITNQFVINDITESETQEIEHIFNTFKSIMALKFGPRFYSALLYAQEYTAETNKDHDPNFGVPEELESNLQRVTSIEGNVVSATFGKQTT